MSRPSYESWKVKLNEIYKECTSKLVASRTRNYNSKNSRIGRVELMKEVEMYDAFQLPAPSQSTLEYLSAGSTHEPASRIGVVQWQQCDTSCSALNNLRRESVTADQPGMFHALNVLLTAYRLIS